MGGMIVEIGNRYIDEYCQQNKNLYRYINKQRLKNIAISNLLFFCLSYFGIKIKEKEIHSIFQMACVFFDKKKQY